MVSLVGVMAACADSSSGPGPSIDHGANGALRIQVLSVTPDSVGYRVEAQLSNVGTGNALIAPYCPGSLEAFRNDVWTNLTASGQCLLLALELPPGADYAVTLRNQLVERGERIRFVSDTAVSPAVVVQ